MSERTSQEAGKYIIGMPHAQ